MHRLPAALVVSIMIAAVVFAEGTIRIFVPPGTTDYGTHALFMAVSYSAAIFVLCATCLRLDPGAVGTAYGPVRPATAMSWLPLVGFALLPIGFAIESPLELFTMVDLPDFARSFYHLRPVDDVLTTHFRSLPYMAATFMVTVLLGPTLEETVFRGWLFERWYRSRGPVFAFLVSSILFGLLHRHFVSAAISGFVFALVYRRYRTLVAPIIVHASVNLCAWSLPFLTEAPWEKDFAHPYALSNWWLELSSAAFVLVLLSIGFALRRDPRLRAWFAPATA